MKIIHESYYNPQALTKVNPEEILREAYSRINTIIGFLQEYDKIIAGNYISALKTILAKEINDCNLDESLFNIEDITKNFTHIIKNKQLAKLIIYSICKRLDLPENYQKEQKEVETTLLNEMQARFHISFYRVKVLTDILGRDNGMELWKKFVYDFMMKKFKNFKNEIFKPIKEKFSDIELENWGKIGSQDFSVVIYDENKAYMKTNRCVVHEAFKEFNDSELSYLAYCYTGSVEDSMSNCEIRRKTPVTLFQDSDFCVEFFYNNKIYPNAEPPTLEEIMRITGKNEKIV